MRKVVIIGAGPVGSLAAVYAAQRGGHPQVDVYELRPDFRDPETTPLNFTKSINLGVSERAINALRHAGVPGLEADVLAGALPMRGRMIHTRDRHGSLISTPQDYDVHGRCVLAAGRNDINRRLLDALAGLPNVALHFNHRLTRVDFRRGRAWVRPCGGDGAAAEAEIEIAFDLLIGADGAHSTTRQHLMKHAQINYRQEYVDTLWCEFVMAPGQAADAGWKISPEHLHIWPAGEFMFIAIPNLDCSFTCTLFLPTSQLADLEADPSRVPAFFDRHFPGVTGLIPATDLIRSFTANPHLPLIDLRCSPHHYGASGVVVGDAAHAMVPFYGQGMNSGMEDVRVLFEMLDKHKHIPAAPPATATTTTTTPTAAAEKEEEEETECRRRALAEYSAVRVPDTHAVGEMARANYVEMRASVLSPVYRARKFVEEMLDRYAPGLGWRTRYARVSFSNEPYSSVAARAEHQGRVLAAAAAATPPLAVLLLLALRWGRPGRGLGRLLK